MGDILNWTESEDKVESNNDDTLQLMFRNDSKVREETLPHLPSVFPGPFLAIPETRLTILLLIYTLVISLASLGSLLVITVVIRRNHLRTQSNCYLLNLAVSDLLLVLVACPFTLTKVSSGHWPFPSFPGLCQLATFLPLLFSFASAFSICLIALDRHQLIVTTQNPRHKTAITTLSILSIWFFAVICAVPILPNTRLEIHYLSPNFYTLLGIKERAYCIEDWGHREGRLYYSLCVLGIQFMFPSIILIMAHARIYRKLNTSHFWGRPRNRSSANEEVELRALTSRSFSLRSDGSSRIRQRGQRTKYLLLSVVIVFMCSWLPLNVLNVLLDLGLYSYLFSTPSSIGGDDSLFRTCFSICHLVGMLSALANPVLYGYYNHGFQKEFSKILCCPGNNSDKRNVALDENISPKL